MRIWNLIHYIEQLILDFVISILCYLISVYLGMPVFLVYDDNVLVNKLQLVGKLQNHIV